MGRARKFDYQAAIQHNLIAASGALTLDELLERSGLEVDRSTLFRHLTALIQQGRVERLGKARASRYRPLGGTRADEAPTQADMPHPAARFAPERLAASLPGDRSHLTQVTDRQFDIGGAFEPPMGTPGTAIIDDRSAPGRTEDVPESADAAHLTQESQESNGSMAENYGPAPAEPKSAPVPAPDYGVAIRKAVRLVVREWKRCDRRNLQIYLSLLAEPEHVEALGVTVEQELAGLHEGNLDLFGLTAAEFSEFDPTPRSAATDD